ncbi:MAG: UXV-star family (seleno)protein [Deltaproteobacteria bacterium]|nr:UXV-star family (seleno)protein [Deltaproteobacteria bacterium]
MVDKDAKKVLIFGKDTCPYTTAAREDYAKRGYQVEYLNVKGNENFLKKMLAFSGGDRNVPVIVEDTPKGAVVTVGFGGT